MTHIESVALAAYQYHIGEVQRLKDRVNALCTIVNARPDCDDIWCRMPIVEGELSGEITVAGYQTLERFFIETLGVGLEAAA